MRHVLFCPNVVWGLLLKRRNLQLDGRRDVTLSPAKPQFEIGADYCILSPQCAQYRRGRDVVSRGEISR